MEKTTYTEISQAYPTKGQAVEKLQRIREHFTAADGWYELDGFVEQVSKDRWRAVRVHEKRWN